MSPACDAVITHAPAPLMCTCAGDVVELSVHGPDATASETVKPELEVAEIPKSASPNVLSVIAPNVIIWSAFAIVNVLLTSGAGL